MADAWGPAGGFSAPPPASPDLDDERPWFVDRSVEARARLLAEIMGGAIWKVDQLAAKLQLERRERDPFAAVLRRLAKRCDLTEFGLGYFVSGGANFWFDATPASVPVLSLDLSDRARVVLEHLKVRTLGELSERSAEQVRSARGRKVLRELRGTLRRYGLTLAEDGDEMQITPAAAPATPEKAEPEKAMPSMPAEPAARFCEECRKKYRLKRPDVAGHYALTYCRACRTRVRTRDRLRAAREAQQTTTPTPSAAEAKPDRPEEGETMITGPNEKVQLERLRTKLLEAENASLRARLGETGVEPERAIRGARELLEQLIRGAA